MNYFDHFGTSSFNSFQFDFFSTRTYVTTSPEILDRNEETSFGDFGS